MTTLERREIPRYLLERGLVSPREIVDGGLRIVDASRSHVVSLVRIGERGGFVVKQPGLGDLGTGPRIDRESLVYGLAGSRSGLHRAMAEHHGDQHGRQLVVLGLLDPAETLLAHQYRLGELATAVAASLGTAVAGWHGDRPAAAEGLPGALPWVLGLFEPGLGQFAWHDPSMGPALATMPDAAGFRIRLERAARSWQRQCLIHGDLRSDNCLVVEGGPRIKVIDWELADHGDPAWDVGGVLQEYFSLEALNGGTDAVLPAGSAAGTSLAGISSRSIGAAFWRAYAAGAQLDGPAAGELLERSVTFAGARMVQTALEYASRDGAQSAAIQPLFRMSAQLLEDGRPFALDLLAAQAS